MSSARQFGARDVDHERTQAHAAALEHRDRFDVRRMRKHVHHPCAGQPEPLGVHQDPGIPRQTPRMTGNIHDSPRTPLCHSSPAVQMHPRAAGRAAPNRSARLPTRRRRRARIDSRPPIAHCRCHCARRWRAPWPPAWHRPPPPPRARARRANGNVKLPSPQNKSSTVSRRIRLQQFTAASTMETLISRLICRKSTGPNSMTMLPLSIA